MTISTLDDLMAVLEDGKSTDDGEALDALAHSLQCAALLGESEPDDVELQVAGLVHDVGTLLAPGRPTTHANTGADAVVGLLGPRVAALVANHDQAKRYLVTTEPAYLGRLSEFSVATLALQGGEMDGSERAAFEAGEHFASAVALRRADDAAKVPGRTVPGLDAWEEPLRRVAELRRPGRGD